MEAAALRQASPQMHVPCRHQTAVSAGNSAAVHTHRLRCHCSFSVVCRAASFQPYSSRRQQGVGHMARIDKKSAGCNCLRCRSFPRVPSYRLGMTFLVLICSSRPSPKGDLRWLVRRTCLSWITVQRMPERLRSGTCYVVRGPKDRLFFSPNLPRQDSTIVA